MRRRSRYPQTLLGIAWMSSPSADRETTHEATPGWHRHEERVALFWRFSFIRITECLRPPAKETADAG